MKVCVALILAGVLGGLATSAAQAQSGADYVWPDYYVGAGVRAGLNDDFAVVIDSKAKITDLGDLTLSARPAALVGNDFELRLPITVEFPIAPTVYPYAGAGVAYNTDGLSAVDPMVTAGLDLVVGRNLVLDLTLNVIFQTAISDTDAELAATLNYMF